ncbi:MAG: hypothetical protein AB7V50_05790 [Vampirovibrionia bacterium]
MNSITKLFDKYKTFEDNLKQERFWLFIPVYLIKTGIKYCICFFGTYLLLSSESYISDLIDKIIPFHAFQTILKLTILIIFILSPGLIYFILFSRKKITIHPYIVTFLFFYCFSEKTLEASYIAQFTSFASGTIVIIIQGCIRLFNFFKDDFADKITK